MNYLNIENFDEVLCSYRKERKLFLRNIETNEFIYDGHVYKNDELDILYVTKYKPSTEILMKHLGPKRFIIELCNELHKLFGARFFVSEDAFDGWEFSIQVDTIENYHKCFVYFCEIREKLKIRQYFRCSINMCSFGHYRLKHEEMFNENNIVIFEEDLDLDLDLDLD
jgi:hypothetical protein